MRNAFADEITKLAAVDERVVLLMGDIGNRLFDKFRSAYPGRFYNCGVAEGNMVSMAAGLASCGLRPFCYTIAPFVTYRVMEQIRLDLCYHRQPVVVVGTGAGLSYASLGATHHSLEDMGMLRILPHMKVTCPGDAMELRAILRAALQQDDPVYMRITFPQIFQLFIGEFVNGFVYRKIEFFCSPDKLFFPQSQLLAFPGCYRAFIYT